MRRLWRGFVTEFSLLREDTVRSACYTWFGFSACMGFRI
jgi:hypothetical protein